MGEEAGSLAGATRDGYTEAEQALMILDELSGDAYAIVYPYEIAYFDNDD